MERVRALQQLGAPIDIAVGAFEDALAAALDILVGRGFVDIDADNGLYRASNDANAELAYYANSIQHWQAQPT
jgi:hypothetical protein